MSLNIILCIISMAAKYAVVYAPYMFEVAHNVGHLVVFQSFTIISIPK